MTQRTTCPLCKGHKQTLQYSWVGSRLFQTLVECLECKGRGEVVVPEQASAPPAPEERTETP